VADPSDRGLVALALEYARQIDSAEDDKAVGWNGSASERTCFVRLAVCLLSGRLSGSTSKSVGSWRSFVLLVARRRGCSPRWPGRSRRRRLVA
jgi:hypothetical protein